MSCCVCGADDYDDDWQRWDDHPARRQWNVLKDLGTGALSQVVLAEHKETGDLAALKVVFLQCPSVADDPEHLALVQRESDLLSMLDHPHIVELKDVVRSPKQLVLVLEWLRGGQVIDRLHELGLQYSEQQAAAVFVQAAEAVAHLHEYRVLHRDIKPENVMFAEPPAEAKAAPLTAAQLQAGRPGGGPKGGPPPRMPVVKLVDLGMACLYDPDKPVTGPLGSPGFVAPEVIAGAPHAPSMDVFSLGVLLFIMLVGRKPFNIKESEDLRYAFTSLQDAPGLKDPRWLDLSPDAKHLVMGMLAYDPARRLTMQQVLDHEWVVSRGGILPRPLGRDVVFGAATVGTIRRLRNLCGGVVAFNRAAAAASSNPDSRGSRDGSGRLAGPADSAKDAYLKRLRQTQRLDRSSRHGTALNRLAASLAGSAYSRAHDAGGSIRPSADASRRGGSVAGGVADASRSARRPTALGSRHGGPSGPQRGGSVRGGSMHWSATDPSASRRNRFVSTLPNGLPRAGTTIMLSEMDRESSRSLSRRGSGHGAPLAPADTSGLERKPSTLQLLASAAKAYLEGSTHGSRRGGTAFANGAGAAGGSYRGGSVRGGSQRGAAGMSRQVVDERAAAMGQQPSGGLPRSPFQQQLETLQDASLSSSGSGSASASMHSTAVAVADDGEGRRRGSVDAAFAAGIAPRTAASSSFNHGSSGSLRGPPLSQARPLASAPPLPPLPAPVAAPPAAAATPPRLLPSLAASAPVAVPAGSAVGGAPADSALVGSSSSSRAQFDALAIAGLRDPVVVKRRSLDCPPVLGTSAEGASPLSSRGWAELQAQLRQQAARQGKPGTPQLSREGGPPSANPSVRVVRLKPLE